MIKEGRMERMSEERKERLRKMKKRPRLHIHLFDASIFATGGLLFILGAICMSVSKFNEQQIADTASRALHGSYIAMIETTLHAINAAGINLRIIGLFAFALLAVIAVWHSLSSLEHSDADRLPEILAEKAGRMANEKPELRGYLIPLAEKTLEEDNETYLIDAFAKIKRFEKFLKKAEQVSLDLDYLCYEKSRYEQELKLLRREMGL